MTDHFDPSTDVTFGTEIVVVLPPEGHRSEKIRKATVREFAFDPQNGLLLIVEVASTKSPGKTYLHAIRPEQIAAPYKGQWSIDQVRFQREKSKTPAGATPMSALTSWAGKKPLLN